MIDLGDPVTLTWVLGSSGTVVATVTLPDGTTSAPTVSGTSTYSATYTTTQAGLHRINWVSSGATVAAHADVFNVEPAAAGLIVSVADALAHLRSVTSITTTADLEQLRWLVAVTSDAVERDLDRILARRTVVETRDGGRLALVLNCSPVISITSVVESGTTTAAGDYTTDLENGVLYRGAATSPQRFAVGRQNVVVTYVAGMLVVPKIARKVALNGVERMWQHSQQAPHSAFAVDVEIATVITRLTPLEMAAYDSLRRGGFA